MKNIKKLFVLSTMAVLSGMQTVQATSTFSPTSAVTITIDSIVNNSNAGDLLGLDIVGLFEIDNISSGQVVTGNGNASFNYTGEGIDSAVAPINTGDSFSQSFSSTGNVANGSVDTFYLALGQLDFINNSADSYTIEYSIDYDLNAVVSGDFATSSVALAFYNDLGDINGFDEADSSVLLSSIVQTLSSESFTLVLGGFETDSFYADVSISGYAESVAAVPVPAAGWLMVSGLLLLRNYRKVAAT